MKDNNIMQKSMAGVGGQPQPNAINDLELANAPFCPTVEPCAPDRLANQNPGDPTPSPPDEREAIVRWLKEQAARCLKNKRELREMLSPTDWDKLTASEMAYRFAAKALKRGDHLSEQGEG